LKNTALPSNKTMYNIIVTPIWISIKTALLATIITFFIGIYAAIFVIRLKRYKGLWDGLFTLPMVLPPTVVGFFLLLFLGKNSFMGKIFAVFDYNFIFSWGATVVSAVVVSFPLMYRTARGAFEQLDQNIISAARTLGISEWRIFWQVMLPNCFYGVLAGVVLSFTRALGEFGATIMVAGNIPGKTQTISTAIYAAVQAGDYELAYKWVGVVVLVSFAVILMLNSWTNRQSKKPVYLQRKAG